MVGFFNTYRQLYPVSRHVLRDIAEQFQRSLKESSDKRNIPVAEAPKGAARPVLIPIKGESSDAVVISKGARAGRIMTAVGEFRKTNRWHLKSPMAGWSSPNFYIGEGDGDGKCVRMCLPTCRSRRVCLDNQHDWLAKRMREEDIDSSNVPVRLPDAPSPNASATRDWLTPWDC